MCWHSDIICNMEIVCSNLSGTLTVLDEVMRDCSFGGVLGQ